jgi:PAS domain S-box-containing protein
MSPGAGSTEVLEALADPGRLAAIEATGLFGPDITAALDDLTALARDVLDVPVALATLVEPEGQTFVGSSGLEDSWPSSRQTPLSHSFCQYVVAEDEPLIVSDAADHPVLRDSPAVTDLQVRAYAGYPLRDPTGVVLGSFCVLDTEPREWTDAELRRLESLAGIATREVATHTLTQELALTNQQNSELIDSALEAIVSVDVEGRIVGWNRHARELFGWSFDEVRGKLVEDVIVPDRLAIHHAAGFRKVAAGGPSTLTGQRIRVPGLHRDGRELLLELSLTASVEGPEGQRFHAFMHDVSAEVAAADALRGERAFLRALLDSLETGVVASDPDGRPQVINKALRRIHRLPGHGPIPDDWLASADLRHADGTPMSPEELPLARACRGEHVRDVETVVHQEGEEPRTFLAHGQPIVEEGGRMLGAVLAVDDVTDLKRHEEEREELLLREQGQVEELRRLYEQRKQFVAVVSHELRSPLSTILGFSQLLLEGRGSLTDTQQKMLTIIENGAHRMLGIVSDLLVLEEVDRDGARFEHRPVNLAPVVQDAVEAMLPTAQAGSVTVTADFSGRTVVDGDEQRLRQVLDNLVSNAVKYTPAGGHVTVAVSGDEHGGTTLTVTDTGIGIPEDERHRLFERFFRTSTARSAGVPGTGLGLAVVRTIVERHGGTITAGPGPEGVGTVFTVRLPALGRRPTSED